MIFEPSLFLSRLLTWFDQNRRDLPWRAPRNAAPGFRLDPYLVFVSEAMLHRGECLLIEHLRFGVASHAFEQSCEFVLVARHFGVVESKRHFDD